MRIAAKHTNRANEIPPAAANHAGVSLQKPTGDLRLGSAAERALLLTGADGIALAVYDGESFVCRAAMGKVAPPVGSRIDLLSGITGACVRFGTLYAALKQSPIHMLIAEAVVA